MDPRQQSPTLGPRPDGSSRVQKTESTADRMAALKARVAAAIGGSQAKGGLNVSLHPALADMGPLKPAAASGTHDWSRGAHSRGRHDRPGLRPTAAAAAATTPRRNDGRQPPHPSLPPRPSFGQPPEENPYLAEPTADQEAGGPKPRQPRQLIFNQRGKFMQQAAALRRQAALEAMKKRIAATTRKAGIEDDPDAKYFLVDEPPTVEWWDQGIVTSYDDLENPNEVKITSLDSIITQYIQHPVVIEPPQERHTVQPKPMHLTKTELKKTRRQRRMRDLKEIQAKQRLGLIPAAEPKVKKSNLMRVLGEEALMDPTLVEARVNREIEDRRQKHLGINEARSLTKEQRHAKLQNNQAKDAAKGIHVLVFKITSLANGQHRYKINVNADQYALTGTCILHPKFNLVIAEGGEHSIAKYKKLMLNRIDWTENAPTRDYRDGGEEAAVDGSASGGAGAGAGDGGRAAPPGRDWLLAEDQRGALKDLGRNECKLVFEGEEKTRMYRKWGYRVCETEAEAREALTKVKMENLWSLAKGM